MVSIAVTGDKLLFKRFARSLLATTARRVRLAETAKLELVKRIAEFRRLVALELAEHLKKARVQVVEVGVKPWKAFSFVKLVRGRANGEANVRA